MKSALIHQFYVLLLTNIMMELQNISFKENDKESYVPQIRYMGLENAARFPTCPSLSFPPPQLPDCACLQAKNQLDIQLQ